MVMIFDEKKMDFFFISGVVAGSNYRSANVS